MWRETSLLAGGDVSWGLATMIAQCWGISPLEVEGPKALAIGGSAEGRYVCRRPCVFVVVDEHFIDPTAPRSIKSIALHLL